MVNTTIPTQLPNELIVLILEYVHQFAWEDRRPTFYACCLVNRQFNTLATPFLWYQPHTSSDDTRQLMFTWIKPYHLQQRSLSLSPGPFIQQLDLRGGSLTDRYLLYLLPYIPNLQTLTIGGRFTDTSIQQLPRHCPRLVSLTVNNIDLSSATLTALGRHCHQIAHLILTNCRLREPNMLHPLTSCSFLQTLQLHRCVMDDDNLHHLVQTLVDDLAQFHHLTHLELTWVTSSLMNRLFLAVSSSGSGSSIGRSPSSSSPGWPYLQKCFFSDCWEIDDTIWLAFIKTHPHLQDISICHCNITNASMIPMATLLPELLHLCFIGYTPINTQGIRQFVRHAPLTLESISCNCCNFISPMDFTELPHPPIFANQGNLVKLTTVEMDIIRRTNTLSTTTATTPID